MSLLLSLLRLFPAAFREQFGAEMVEQIRLDHERASSAGRAATVAFFVGTTADLVVSAIAERWRPTWRGVAWGPQGRGGRVERMSEWMRDLRHAGRGLRRTPGFALISVGTLGLAIGANAGIFSVVDTVLLNPLPYGEADRLIEIGASAPGTDMPERFGVAPEFYLHYREHSQLLEDVAGGLWGTSTLRADDRVERVPFAYTTASLFSTLGATPILGRLPTEEDEDRVAVISHGLWQSWFGGDPTVLGRAYEMAGATRTVIGVMGPEFGYPTENIYAWIPMVIRAESIRPGQFGFPLVARLAPGATQEAVVEELTHLARQLPDRFGGSAGYQRIIEAHRPVVRSLEESLLGGISGALWILLAAVGIVLLIASANVTNLFIVRAERRQRDLAVRQAIGAGRMQLIGSQMAESVLVALLAGAVALALAGATVPLFLRAAPPDVPRLGDVRLTPITFVFTFVVSIVTGLLCGLIPAIRASSPNLARLREAGRGTTRRRYWARDLLVVGQTALALVLLIGSGLLIRSYQALRNVDPGYDTEDIFTFQIAPEGAHLPDAVSYAQFHLDFMERVAAMPGVERVGIVENVPLDEGVRSTRFLTPEMGGTPDTGPLLSVTFAAGDYFETMGISVLQGRTFTRDDHFGQRGNVILSRSAAERLWPGENPIGRRVQRSGLDSWETVIGVVEDVMQYGFRDEAQPLVYFPLVGQNAASWQISSPGYVVKTARAEVIAPEIRAIVREVAPEAPMYRMYTMEGLAADSMVQLSFTMLTLGIAAVLALILGAVGLYGILSYIVAERTPEIGVRMALGAQASLVRRMIVAQGARVVLLGVVLGVVVALAATRALGSLLFGVRSIDGTTFVAMSLAMVGVGMLASYVPARRASNVDPIQSLRAT